MAFVSLSEEIITNIILSTVMAQWTSLSVPFIVAHPVYSSSKLEDQATKKDREINLLQDQVQRMQQEINKVNKVCIYALSIKFNIREFEWLNVWWRQTLHLVLVY